MLNAIKTPAIVAVGVSTILAGFYFLGKDEVKKVPQKNQSKKKKRKKKKNMSKKDLIAFTTDFKKAVKDCRFQVNLEEQQIQMNAQRQGIPVPDMELHTHLSQSFKKGLKVCEQKLYTKYDITPESAKEAGEKYTDDPEYKTLCAAINKTYTQITKPPSAEPPKLLDLATFKKILDEYIHDSHLMWDEIEKEMKNKKLGAGSSQTQQQLMQNIQEKTQDVMDLLFERFKIDKYAFENGLRKYMADPSIGQKMQKMQQIPQQRLQRMGLAPRGRMPGR